MAKQKRSETFSCETSFNNNHLIESCVWLYILYIYILLLIKHNGNVSPENKPNCNVRVYTSM
jgi:hypothetical protein